MKSLKSGCSGLIVFFVFNLLNLNCFSQFSICVTGTDPGSAKWEQINSPHFKLIYPLTFKEHAQHIANGLEYFQQRAGNTLGTHVKTTPVILHDRTTIPSSLTIMAPYRMDFFTTPPQDYHTYLQDWMDQLIIHEYRHANQYNSLNTGYTKGLSNLFGQTGTLFKIARSLPLWFVEGDATVAETAFSLSGRGRLPSHQMRLRAQLLEKGMYSYEKTFNNSYKDMIPGNYEVGYQIVGMAREKYGADIWGKVVNRAGKFHVLTPFSGSLKKECGLNKYDLYKTLITDIQNKWEESDKKIIQNQFYDISNTNKEPYTNYNIPVIFRDSLFIAAKSSLSDLTKVVMIDRNMKETTLFTAGVNFLPESFSVSDSILYWSEQVNDPRWSLRDYRVIKSYNLITGKARQLTHQSRYFSPSVSSDGGLIVAVEVTIENKFSLIILNSADGSVLKRITTPENLFFIHPVWSPDASKIITVVLGNDKNSIAIADPGSGEFRFLLPFTAFEIRRPFFYGKYAIYSASYKEIENFYALDTASREIFQVTSARFGATEGCVGKNDPLLVYANYTADGYNLSMAELHPDSWEKISTPAQSAFPLAEKLTEQENFIFNHDSVPAIQYPVKTYHKGLNLFNFHGWIPLNIDLENGMQPGVQILSQNLLGTSITDLGYIYDLNTSTGKYYLQYSYEGFYPAFDLGTDFGRRKGLFNQNEDDTIIASWNEWNITSAVRLPLNWSHNNWIRKFVPSIGITLKGLETEKVDYEGYIPDRMVTINGTAVFSNMMKTSYRDLFPRWGQEINLNYIRSLDWTNKNSVLAGDLKLYFPGIGKHHSIELSGGYQKKEQVYYNFQDFISYPFGYTNIYQKEIVSLHTGYSLPLLYPDWRISHLLFIKRIKATFFYDYAEGFDQTPHNKYSTAGLDLRLDLCPVNFLIPLDIGLRSGYMLENNKLAFQFLIDFNLDSMF
jgi:hypothetical protein